MKPSRLVDISRRRICSPGREILYLFDCYSYTVACSSFDTDSSGCGNVHDRKTTGTPISNDVAILLAT